jgi:hypothetical protein
MTEQSITFGEYSVSFPQHTHFVGLYKVLVSNGVSEIFVTDFEDRIHPCPVIFDDEHVEHLIQLLDKMNCNRINSFHLFQQVITGACSYVLKHDEDRRIKK